MGTLVYLGDKAVVYIYWQICATSQAEFGLRDPEWCDSSVVFHHVEYGRSDLTGRAQTQALPLRTLQPPGGLAGCSVT